jgi:hypothetical protein
VLVSVGGCGAAASEPETAAASVSASRQYAFDIPAQPLASAVQAFSGVTGIEVIYDSAVAGDRRSAEVRGSFTPADALRALLAGTSLIARSIAQDAVTLEPAQTTVAPIPEPSPEKSAHRAYFSLIQAGLERAFCADAQIRPGDYRAVLKFTIDPNGQIRQPRVVGTTGSEVRDQMIARKLEGIPLGSSPPADLSQPIMLIILPQSSGPVLNCASIH